MIAQTKENNLLPTIDITERDLPLISIQGWDALIKVNSPPYIFSYGNNLVRLINRKGGRILIEVLDGKKLRHELARCAKFVFIKKDQTIIDLPPSYLVHDMLVESNPPLPNLSRIVSAPVFSKNGNIHIKPGYDPLTECYLHLDEKFEIPDVPEHPPKDHVERAKTWVEELLLDFPFTGESEKTHAISLLLCPFVRDMIRGPVPVYIIEAPSPGTGKTLLAQVLAYPSTGKPLEAMSESRNSEEMRKRITAKLLNSPTHIFIDNVRHRIAYSSLASSITSGVWEDRRLGVSQTVRIPVTCTWIITGNNPSLSSEMARRCVRIRLDTGREQPWLRDPIQFKHKNLLSWVKSNRGQLAWAAIILIQNWVSKAKPVSIDMPTMGMFEDWCRVMGGILEANGIKGFLENLNELYTDSDIEIAVWRSFTETWWQAFDVNEVSTAQLYSLVVDNEIPIELGFGTDHSQKIRLGKQISKMRQRQFGQYRIVAAKQRNHAQVWRLELVNLF